MTRKIMMMAIGATALVAAVPALAQESKPVGLSIRAGIFFPTDSLAKAIAGKNWFAFGAEYKVMDLNLGTKQAGYSGHLSISADYMNKSGFSNTPVLLNYVGNVGDIFYSAGAGISFAKIPGDSKARLGYQASIGYNFTKMKMPIFIEAKYFGVSGREELNGFGIYLGIRL